MNDPRSVEQTDRDGESHGAPALSVIVVRFAGGDAVARTLDALRDAVGGGRVEVIVAHRGDDAPAAALVERYPWARWLPAEVAAPPARLRAVGVDAARAPLVACTEDHCVPAADWCERIEAAHAERRAVVGGAIDKATPATSVAWAAYLLDYSRYMSPLPPGPANFASDCNVSYRRADLLDTRERWHEAFHETTVHWALGQRGIPLVLDPTIVVRQDREVDVDAYLAERVEHGATYAHTRVEHAGGLVRLRLGLMAFLLPPVLVWRVWQRVTSRGQRRAVPRAAWTILARSAMAWARGERRGYGERP